jgi:hypothetical protein
MLLNSPWLFLYLSLYSYTGKDIIRYVIHKLGCMMYVKNWKTTDRALNLELLYWTGIKKNVESLIKLYSLYMHIDHLITSAY